MNVSWFTERDIDLFLCEELFVNPSFARWFLSKVGLDPAADLTCERTQPSVVVENGETDVEAIFQLGNRKIALLIENKIDAAFQPDQLARYLARGRMGIARGAWEDFRVCLFAPKRYVETCKIDDGVYGISFEAAEAFLRASCPSPRIRYKADFLREIFDGYKKSGQATGAPENIPFWTAVFDQVLQDFPDFVPKKSSLTAKSTFINPATHDLPTYLRLDLKGMQGSAELTFKTISLTALKHIFSQAPPDVKIVINGTCPALKTSFAPFLTSEGMEAVDKARKAFAAAHMLIELWRANREACDQASAQSA